MLLSTEATTINLGRKLEQFDIMKTNFIGPHERGIKTVKEANTFLKSLQNVTMSTWRETVSDVEFL